MLPDDVFRDRLEETLVGLEAWANETRDCAVIDIAASPRYWRMSVTPHMAGACSFELVVKADQTFDLRLDREIYENEPVNRFDFFPRLAAAIAAGHVERIETLSALTGALIEIEMRVELADDWDWTGRRRVAPSLHTGDLLEERHSHRFLPYRR